MRASVRLAMPGLVASGSTYQLEELCKPLGLLVKGNAQAASPDVLKHARAKFQELDVDASGHLSGGELVALVRVL